MSVPAPERKESPAEYINTAREIDKEALKLYSRPCYADIRDALLIELYHQASKVLECCVRANDIYLPTSKDRTTVVAVSIPKAKERIALLVEAKGYLAALNAKTTELYTVRPIKHRYRGQKKRIAGLLGKEYNLLKGMITSDENRLKKLEKIAGS